MGKKFKVFDMANFYLKYETVRPNRDHKHSNQEVEMIIRNCLTLLTELSHLENEIGALEKGLETSDSVHELELILKAHILQIEYKQKGQSVEKSNHQKLRT
jgi:hypothetical protein